MKEGEFPGMRGLLGQDFASSDPSGYAPDPLWPASWANRPCGGTTAEAGEFLWGEGRRLEAVSGRLG